MGAPALTQAKRIPVSRSDLRSNQRAILRQVTGSTVVLVRGNDEGDEKIVVDRAYFDEVLKRLKSLRETLEITMDQKLFPRLLAVADKLDENVRLGKLHSIDEAFRD